MANKVSCPTGTPCKVGTTFVTCGKADTDVVSATITDDAGNPVAPTSSQCIAVAGTGVWSMTFSSVTPTPTDAPPYKLNVQFAMGACAAMTSPVAWPTIKFRVFGPGTVVPGCTCPTPGFLVGIFLTLFRSLRRLFRRS
jgi:hypothetical protein